MANTLTRGEQERVDPGMPLETRSGPLTRLLHIAASPRGASSESLQIAQTFIDAYGESHPGNPIEISLPP